MTTSADGRGPARRRAPTIKDVAQAAQVSTATVSRVVSANGYPVSAESRARVLEVVRRMGYTPNDLARSLLKDTTRTIGIVVPDLANPHHPDVLRGVEEVAVANGYSVLFCSIDGHAERLTNYLNVMAGKRVDGLIMAGGGLDVSPSFEQIHSLGFKTIVVGRYSSGELPSVEADNLAAGRLAAEHLVAQGHRSFIVITGPSGSPASADRLAGAQGVFDENSLSARDVIVVESPFSSSGGYAAALSVLSAGHRPTALIAASDVIAVGAMAAANDLGLGVPDDLAVVGYDDVEVARYLRPSLTSIALPTREMGVIAMEHLLTLLRGGSIPPRTVADVRLVVRESTTP